MGRIYSLYTLLLIGILFGDVFAWQRYRICAKTMEESHIPHYYSLDRTENKFTSCWYKDCYDQIKAFTYPQCTDMCEICNIEAGRVSLQVASYSNKFYCPIDPNFALQDKLIPRNMAILMNAFCPSKPQPMRPVWDFGPLEPECGQKCETKCSFRCVPCPEGTELDKDGNCVPIKPECDPKKECCDGIGKCCDPDVECCDEKEGSHCGP